MSVVQLQFSGGLSLGDMSDVHAKFSAALNEAESIEIDLSKVTDAPLAFVQLVQSARRSAERDGKSLRISASAPVVRAMCERGAFCANANDRAFWLVG